MTEPKAEETIDMTPTASMLYTTQSIVFLMTALEKNGIKIKETFKAEVDAYLDRMKSNPDHLKDRNAQTVDFFLEILAEKILDPLRDKSPS